MKLLTIIASLLIAANLAFSAGATGFEIHAVADAPSPTAKIYLLRRDNGPVEKVLLDSAVLLDGAAIQSAKVVHDQNGPAILITLTDAGKKRFGEITAQHVGKRLGIVIDGELFSAPLVKDAIFGGSMQLSANFTKEQEAVLLSKLNPPAK